MGVVVRYGEKVVEVVEDVEVIEVRRSR